MRKGIAQAGLLVPLVALTACGGGKHPASAQRSHAPPHSNLVAILAAPGHTPKVGKPWRITITAKDHAGHPVHARVQYFFLAAGRPVAHRSNYSFVGSFHDDIGWPAQAVGIPLTFRALVTSSIGTRALDYPVTVQR